MPTREDVLDYLLDEEPEYRRAAEALGPDALPVLREIAATEEPLLASKATRLASEIGSPRAWDVLEVAAARDAAPTVRVAAAAALRRLAARESKETPRFVEQHEELLERLLSDSDAGVRQFAITAAMQMELRDRVERVAEDPAEPDYLREFAAEALRGEP